MCTSQSISATRFTPLRLIPTLTQQKLKLVSSFTVSPPVSPSHLGGLGEVLGDGAGEMVLGGTGGGTSRRFMAGESKGELCSRTRELTARACRVVAHPSWTKCVD